MNMKKQSSRPGLMGRIFNKIGKAGRWILDFRRVATAVMLAAILQNAVLPGPVLAGMVATNVDGVTITNEAGVDTLRIADGDDVVFYGTDGPLQRLTLDAGTHGLVALGEGSTLTIMGNDVGGSNGGAIFADSGTMFDMTAADEYGRIFFIGNKADLGGAIYSLDGVLNLTNATFTDNMANMNGGGIYAESWSGDTTVTLSDGARFEGNIAGNNGYGEGGGIYAGSGIGNVTVTLGAGAAFTENIASGNGGGIFAGSDSSGNVTVMLGADAAFTGNVACNGDYGYGGGIYVSAARSALVTLGDGVLFTGNIAGQTEYGFGGGILVNALSGTNVLHVGDGATFTGNIAGNAGEGYGGGIMMDTLFGASEVNVGDHVTFTDNIAGNAGDGMGGGMAVASAEGTVTVNVGDDATFTGNIAGNAGYGDGGGIFAWSMSDGDATVTLGDGATFTGNIAGNAGGHGGGIYAMSDFGDVTVTLGDGATFTDNIAGNNGFGLGGGIYAESMSGATVTLGADATFTGNIAGNDSYGDGGGIYAWSMSNTTVTLGADATFTDNIAGNDGYGYGGGIYAWSGSRATVTLGDSATFTDNIAGNGSYGYGGGIYAWSGLDVTVTLGDWATFVDNIAGNANTGTGGGIYAKSNSGVATVVLGAGAAFMDNIAGNAGTGEGGGIYAMSMFGTTVTLGADATFTDNIAGNDGYGLGGGIHARSDSDTTVTLGAGATFTDNIAGNAGVGRGGGIYMWSMFSTGGASVTLGDGATFRDNIAGNSSYGTGGGIHAESKFGSGGASVSLGDNATFTGNIAGNSSDGGGGGIYALSNSGGTTVTLGADATFTGNIAGNDSYGVGGGIHAESFGGVVSVMLGAGATFTDNIAGNGDYGRGGGIYAMSDSGDVTVTLGHNAYLSGNRAGSGDFGQGGAICIDGGDLNLFGNTLLANNATAATSPVGDSLGGAIYLGWIGTNTATLDADTGPIAFVGNKVGVTVTDATLNTWTGGVANSIHMERNTQLALTGAYGIYFDDPISSGAAGGNSLVKSGDGFVQFVGDSRLNTAGFGVGNSVDIQAGTFRLAEDATFDASGAGDFRLASGATLAGQGTISAQGFAIQGTIAPDGDRFAIPTFRAFGDEGMAADHYNFFESDAATSVSPEKNVGTLTLMGDVVFSDARLDIDVDGETNDRLIVVGNASIEARKSLSTGIGPTAVLVADTFDFNTSGTLNITGYTNGDVYPSGPQVVISTLEGVKSFNAAITVLSQSTVDFLSARAFLGNEGADVMVETTLTWFSTDPTRPAHGDFTIDGIDEAFTLGVALTDNASTNRRGDWDGTTLTKKGEGTLILTGENTYTGSSVVEQGTLQIGNGGDSGSVAGDIEVQGGANVTFHRSDNVEFHGVISGEGSLTKAGDNTLMLTGANTFTGSVNLNEGTLALSGGGTLTNANSLTMAANTTFDYSAADAYINSSPGLLKNLTINGTDTWIIPGAGGADFSGGALVFSVPNGVGDGDTLLNVDGDANMNGATVTVKTASGRSPVAKGEKLVLVDVKGDLESDIASMTVQATNGDTYTIEVDDDQLFAILAGVSPDTPAYERLKAYSEARTAALAFQNQGLEAILNQGFGTARIVTKGPGFRVNSFGAAGGGKVRHHSGSHVDVSGLSMLLGVAAGTDVFGRQHDRDGDSPIGRATGGVFFESGWGSFRSHNAFRGFASVDGGGNLSYYGGGLLGRYDVTGGKLAGLYFDASARAGWQTTEFRSDDIRYNGTRAGFDTSAVYVGGHGGTGYIWTLPGTNDKGTLDMSAKVMWTHLDSDSVRVYNDRVRFGASDSLRSRLGGRFRYAINEYVSPYIGAYWEHEFDGSQRATVNGRRIASPTLRGDTATGEVGLTITPSKKLPISIDLGVQGYTGKREGLTGSLQLRWDF